MRLHVAGKTFNDVADAAGDIRTDGTGRDGRYLLATHRLWNHHVARARFDACPTAVLNVPGCDLGMDDDEGFSQLRVHP